jgi:hypothetical protein
MNGHLHAPPALPPEKFRYTLDRRLGGPQVLCERFGEKSPFYNGIRNPDHPSCSVVAVPTNVHRHICFFMWIIVLKWMRWPGDIARV